MMVTGVTVERLTDKALPSSYSMISEIRKKLLSWSPAIFIGYNSLKFDEHILRHEFYKNLFPAYLTNSNKNSRIDAMRLMQIAAALEPSCLKTPPGKDGKPSFKLDQIAPLNGFDHKHAHDALSDVEATIYLCKLIRDSSSEPWSNVMRFSQKAAVRDFTDSEEIFCLHEVYYGKPFFFFMSSLGTNPDKTGEIYAFDLKGEPATFENLDDESLRRLISGSPKPIRRFKANSCPMLFPLDGLPDRITLSEHDHDTFVARARYLTANPELQKRLIRCYEGEQPEGSDAPHVESKLYEGFFSDEDTKKMEQFHMLPWEERYSLVQSFGDGRLKELGTRVIYFEKRHLLSHDDRLRLDVLFAERIMASGDSLPWTTLPAATREWAESARDDISELANGHRQYMEYLREWAAGVLNIAAAA